MIDIVKKALLNSYKVIMELGSEGTEELETNECGDPSLKGDYEAEEAVIKVLKDSGLGIRIVSEEHGSFDLGKPEYIGVLDGLDGSSLYKKDWKNSRAGTMFVILNGLDPKYGDYLAAGIMEHATGKLYLASKGKGCFVYDLGNEQRVKVSEPVSFDKARIYVNSFEPNQRIYQKISDKFETKDIASAANFIDLICGKVNLVLECTFILNNVSKKNLELAVAYGMVKEADGFMIDENGDDLGQKRYLEFGMDRNIAIISGCSKGLVLSVLDFI